MIWIRTPKLWLILRARTPFFAFHWDFSKVLRFQHPSQQRNKYQISRTFTPFINRPAKEAIRFTQIQRQDCLCLQKSLTRNVGNAADPAVAIAPSIMRMSRMTRRLCLNWQRFDLLFSVLSVLLYAQSHNLSETEKRIMQKISTFKGGCFWMVACCSYIVA